MPSHHACPAALGSLPVSISELSTLQRRTGIFDSDISTYGLPEGRGMGGFILIHD